SASCRSISIASGSQSRAKSHPGSTAHWRLADRPLSAGCPRFPQLSHHAVFNPVRIPPFGGVDELAVHQHAEMKVIAPGKARLAREPQRLALVHVLAVLH